ncbi:natural killer cell receptor 2B4 isoform X2 [Oncorhynchus tshawytscha]|uniref:natural killer cell receptor 2B4 isoform X2 n=1 Tax=Oncorhynchus tshawytscha TaxID=74940 RepID=UPI001C3E1F69|nr:natural killer cell receptor 2B4 isoform X2 [Oncorhynchus tshawytscha]
MSLLLGFGLLTCIASSDFSSVFVLKGQDICLDVQENVQLRELEVFKWSFGSANILRCTDTLSVRVSPRYNNRVEFYKGNFSLLLKNIQEGDSGPYTAVVSGDKEKTIIVHQLVLQERVEPPVLTLDSNSTINGNCNVTVTCRGQKTSVTSSCNSSTCSQVGGESRGAETSTVPLLSVYVAGGSIICNHSNQVSWANDTKEIVELCPMKSGIGLLTCIASSERVEPPVLTVDSVSSINGICNVTVTCRGQKTSVTSSCNNSTCSQVGGESRGAETSTVPLLSVYVAGVPSSVTTATKSAG